MILAYRRSTCHDRCCAIGLTIMSSLIGEPGNRGFQTNFKRSPRRPSEKLPGPRDVRTAAAGIIDRKGRLTTREAEPVIARTLSARSPTVSSTGLPRLTAPGKVAVIGHEAQEAVDEVGHVAEGAGLAAVAVDRDVIARQRLADHVGDHAAVVGPHARPIGVEDRAPPARPARRDRSKSKVSVSAARLPSS